MVVSFEAAIFFQGSNKDFNFMSNVYINSKNRVILRYKGVVLWNMVETLWLKVLEKLVKDPI